MSTTKKNKSKQQKQTKVPPPGVELPFGKMLHPLAVGVPNMSANEFADLTADMERNGLRDPITLDHTRKLVIDGRHRLVACETLKIKPKWVRLPKNVNVARFIISRLTHRNLTTGQRAMIAADLLPEFEKEAKVRQKRQQEGGGNLSTTPQPDSAKARDEAAKTVGVSGRSVQEAKKLKEKDPEKAEAVRKGHLKLHAARKDKKPKKDKPKRSEKAILDDVQADYDRQVAALERKQRADDEAEDTASDEPAGTTAPTQRVRSWLSSVKRCLSETTALVGLAEDSEFSDDERDVVQTAMLTLREALNDLASVTATVGAA